MRVGICELVALRAWLPGIVRVGPASTLVLAFPWSYRPRRGCVAGKPFPASEPPTWTEEVCGRKIFSALEIQLRRRSAGEKMQEVRGRGLS